MIPAPTVGSAAGDGVSGEEEVAMAAGLGSLTIRPAKRSAVYREGRHYPFSPRHSYIHVCSSMTKKFAMFPGSSKAVCNQTLGRSLRMR